MRLGAVCQQGYWNKSQYNFYFCKRPFYAQHAPQGTLSPGFVNHHRI